MAKTKTVWVCSSCGNDFPKWEGRCSACGAWNTLVEEKVTISSQTRAKSGMTSR
ncbi:MAG: DNA repair protein RadA, partial [Muribaculaceae bacterium]|nr:DNA repair protein RadA [Muribaculaceae bacterium]